MDASLISDLEETLARIAAGSDELIPLKQIKEIQKSLRSIDSTETLSRRLEIPNTRNFDEVMDKFDNAVVGLFDGQLDEIDAAFARGQQLEDIFNLGRGKLTPGTLAESADMVGRRQVPEEIFGRFDNPDQLINVGNMDSALDHISKNPRWAVAERQALEAAEAAVEAGEEGAERLLTSAQRTLDQRITEMQRAFLDGHYDRIIRQNLLGTVEVPKKISGLLNMDPNAIQSFMRKYYPTEPTGGIRGLLTDPVPGIGRDLVRLQEPSRELDLLQAITKEVPRR